MTTIAERIDKRISSLEKKIDALSGSYLTNTAKRQREQRHRDDMKEKYRQYIQVLRFLSDKAGKENLTRLEQNLLTGAFYEDLLFLLASKRYHEERGLPPIEISHYSQTVGKRLQKGGIANAKQLNQALDAFGALIEQAVTPEDPRRAHIRDLTYRAQLMQRGDIQFTPAGLASKMVLAARLTPESRVLEPEAGIGSIADEAKKITPHVDCVERVCDFREILEYKGYRLLGDDFLEMEPQPVYDAVLMNPPFSDEYRHIQHAYEFLAPGGVLVSVGSDHIPHPPAGRKHQEFQDWLALHNHSVETTGAQFEMTSVNSCLLILPAK